jgi:hypothetical protein
VTTKVGFIENARNWMRSRLRSVRTVVPGKITATEDGTRERSADFTAGIADLIAGEASPASVTPDAPMLFQSGGGFAVLLPSAADDEVLGLVSDRAIGPWRQDRDVGGVDEINGKRSHNMSDVLLTQFSMSAPSSAPATWDHYMVIGPGGKAIEVNTDDSIVLTKQGSAVATITMAASGSIVVATPGGQTIKFGDDTATLGVARQTDSVAADASMQTFITQTVVAIAAIAAKLNAPGPVVGAPGTVIPAVAPSDFGLISSGSTTTLST